MRIEYKRLKDCCTKIGSGATPKGGSSVYIDSGVSLIRSQNVYNLNFSYTGLAHINDEAAKKLKGVIVNKGDVLLNITGDSVARTCVVPDEVLPARVNQHVSIIRPNKDIDSRYLNYYLASPAMQGYLLNIASTGASRNAITKGMIEKLVIPFPNKVSQCRIASILSAYDNLIENNNKRIRLLEQMAENLYKEWFVRFRFPGHEKAEFENGLPKGWRIGRLFEYGRVETGKTPSMLKQEYYGGEYLFIKTPDMHGNMFVRESEETLSEKGNLSQPKKLLPKSSIMVSCIGSGGVVAINAKQGHTNQQINSIILSNTENLEWLYFTCKALKPMIELFGATGATMTNLSKGKFEKLKIIEPPLSLRKLFHLKTTSIFDEILKLDENIANLSRQRDLLLPRLMSGKLVVNV